MAVAADGDDRRTVYPTCTASSRRGHNGSDMTTPLEIRIRAMIEKDGPMPVDMFMALCLTDPEDGYYRSIDPLGAAGDFTTAPEISQMFGELVGLWLYDEAIKQGLQVMRACRTWAGARHIDKGCAALLCRNCS